MHIASRLLATAFAAIVWALAGITVASGSLAPKAITPSALDAAAVCITRIAN